MADEKITAIPQMTTAIGTDILPIVDDPGVSPETQYIEVEDFVVSIAASAAEITAGTETKKVVTPDTLAGSGYGMRTALVELCSSYPLTTSDKRYFRVPSWMNGWNLVEVAAMCKVASTSGAITLTIKNGATSMLSTNITIDANEYDTLTAATAAVIDTSQDDVATGEQIEFACTGAGTGATFVMVSATFQAP